MRNIEWMEKPPPVAPLAYEVPRHKPPRRWRVLPPPLAVSVVVCGTVLIATPCVAVCVLRDSGGYGVPDYVMALLWATASAGLLIALLGIFLAAPDKRPRRRAR